MRYSDDCDAWAVIDLNCLFYATGTEFIIFTRCYLAHSRFDTIVIF